MALQSLLTEAISWHPLTLAAIGLAAVWGVWRYYTFTIRPLWHPEEPKEVPYAIPFIGHLWQFFNDADTLINNARLYFNDSREPFALGVAGTKTYVLTKSEDVATAYRNTTTLSFDIFVQYLMRSCGTSEKTIDAMFAPLDVDGGFPNPRSLPLGRLSRELHIHQLFPGENFDELGVKFVGAFDRRLEWSSILNDAGTDAKPKQSDVVVPLMAWTSDIFTLAGQDAYFGPQLGEIDREMHKTFLIFDEVGWQVLYQYPRILSGTMSRARDNMVATLEKYFDMPQEKRTGDAWFVKAEENEMRARDISTHDIATMMLPIYWGINTNTRKLAFWLLSYILRSEKLVQTIREESQTALDDNGRIDHKKVEDLVHLNGAFYEAIRLSAFSASVRYVSEDTIIGGKVLRKGNRLMIPYRQLHYNSDVFGDKIHEFDPDRFIRDEKLLRSQSWRPFGGGNTMCPGRHVAKQAVCTFVAQLLQKYEVTLEPGQAAPEAETKKPVLGIMDRKEGSSDIFVRLKPLEA